MDFKGKNPLDRKANEKAKTRKGKEKKNRTKKTSGSLATLEETEITPTKFPWKTQPTAYSWKTLSNINIKSLCQETFP